MANASPPLSTKLPRQARWRLVLVGRPYLERDHPPARVRLSPKDAALLALVAMEGPIASERVVGLVWPNVDACRADASLRQRLFRLRRELGTNLVSQAAQLQLSSEIETDIGASLARIADDEDAARDELLGDLEFDALPGLAAWLMAARERWRLQRDAALAAAAAACEASGSIARGLAYARRLAEGDPLSEHAQRRLMRLHYLRGDCSAAIASFEHFEQRLKDELGTRPSAETIELLTTIERGSEVLPVHRVVVPASLMRPPRLVGRSSEMSALAHAWAGERAFALVGEAGIGKSRLLREFSSASEGLVSVQARPGDAGIAYAVLARLLRAVIQVHAIAPNERRRQELALVLPELGPSVSLAGESQRLLLLRAVDTTLAEAVGLGLRVVIVDDLHFADDASVEFLQSLTQSESLAALRWGFAHRPADAGAAISTLRGALEEGQRLEVVSLGPLNSTQMVELIDSLALPGLDSRHIAPALLKHTGGNPMFALETLKDVLLSGAQGAIERLPQPTTVGALIDRRLAQLSPAALKLARVAALAGESFSAELAATVLELHPLDFTEPWRELEAAQVIRDGAFAHDLIFEATRVSVPAPIGQLLHRRIATFLLARMASPATIAPHWAAAHEWSAAGEAYAQAARQAQGASQRSHEVEHWHQAGICFDKDGDADRAFDMRCESIAALIIVKGVAHANRVIDALLVAAHNDGQRVAALTARAMAALMAADHEVGVAAAVQAGELAAGLVSPWPRFEAARLHAVGLAQGGRAAQGLAIIEPFRELVERDGSIEHKGRFWSDYAYVLNVARRLRDTALALERAIESTRLLSDLAELATLTSNLATVKGNLGSVDEALDLSKSALAIQVQLGAMNGPGGGVVETYVGLYSGMIGRYGEALDRLDTAIARFQRDEQTTWIAVASNHKVLILSQLGQFARARQTLDYAVPAVDWVRARGAALASRIDRALGQSGESALHNALSILDRGGDPHVRMQALLDHAERLEPTAALARCDEVLNIAGELEFVGVSMRAGLLRALALHRGGRSTEAARQLRGLLPRLDKVQPADMYLPDAWWIAVQVFDACSATDEAMMALARGTHWIRQVALPHVPEAFRASFLERNETNRSLLAAAGRRSL